MIYKRDWHWYVTEKDWWFLDKVKQKNAFIDLGYGHHDLGDGSERFGIDVLDETTAKEFLQYIEEYRVESKELSKMILKLKNVNHWDDISDYCPSLLVDFDHQQLYSLFPEPASFENYVPEGWLGVYKNFLDKVPREQRYWIINGEDYFKPFFGSD
ncbi:hypothetical protein GCM10011571_26970 [Marinithermofilum abyssi]|uniref:Uncharacterized protein n=1 Tax=Marinithermofilum abyssi TaxID=1571185 RepID=A0A8J2VD74_9BACL|nr:hypothetical protein [Marinithermofilum abyssi]GGE23467.1 hypothetical protein GCM10011571_26970 [Marinithermofilum abyssi]